MAAYDFLSTSYDRLTNDVDYGATWSYLQSLFQKYNKAPKSIVDLACGTGSLSVLMAQSGLTVIGIDCSEEMLTVASGKAYAELRRNRPQFVMQKMQNLHLPCRVDAVVSCLDSVNYLTDPEDLNKTVLRVYKSLNKGGIFIFDMNTPLKFRTLDGQICLDEDDNVFCVWRPEFDSESRIMTYGMDIFRREGKIWRRFQEEHLEYAYEPAEVRELLLNTGFAKVDIFGDRVFADPEQEEQRIYFVCLKEEL